LSSTRQPSLDLAKLAYNWREDTEDAVRLAVHPARGVQEREGAGVGWGRL